MTTLQAERLIRKTLMESKQFKEMLQVYLDTGNYAELCEGPREEKVVEKALHKMIREIKDAGY